MTERNQDGYQTLDWILNHSDQGFFLVVAEEELQREILSVYQESPVGIYDYREHPGPYSFQLFSAWLEEQKNAQTIFLANLQFAVQREDDVKRLNFSRDMLARLEKNLIFLTTPYGDNFLAAGAYDFYSFFKLRILFHPYQTEWTQREEIPRPQEPFLEEAWTPEESRQKLEESHTLINQSRWESDNAQYSKSEQLLLKAKNIREKLLGTKHIDTSVVYHDMAILYMNQGRYKEAEILFKKSLSIRESVWGANHPDTARNYSNLACLYHVQGKYIDAEILLKKALSTQERTLGRGNLETIKTYNNLAILYADLGRYEEAKVLFEKVLSIGETIDHPDTNVAYNNLNL